MISKVFKGIKRSFLESSRYKHFFYSILIGFIFTIFGAVGANAGSEYKDTVTGGKWDWEDVFWGILGGVIGQALQVVLILLIF